jgi:hypothetical protein
VPSCRRTLGSPSFFLFSILHSMAMGDRYPMGHRHMDTFLGPPKLTPINHPPRCNIGPTFKRNRYYRKGNTPNRKDSKECSANILSLCIYRRGANKIPSNEPRMRPVSGSFGAKLIGKQPSEELTCKNSKSR